MFSQGFKPLPMPFPLIFGLHCTCVFSYLSKVYNSKFDLKTDTIIELQSIYSSSGVDKLGVQS